MQINSKILQVILILLLMCLIGIKPKNNNASRKTARKLFLKYKRDFAKHYDNKTEELKGFKNFANNLNKIRDLNAKLANDTHNTKSYVVNKFTDVDTEEFDEHYGFKLLPYDEVNKSLALRSQPTKNKENTARSIEDANLYDLQQSNLLYDQYLKQFNKTNSTNDVKRTIRYYRFVKTLVEINRNNLEGKELRTLDANADKIQKPHEFFY